jgi:hypothetical protein
MPLTQWEHLIICYVLEPTYHSGKEDPMSRQTVAKSRNHFALTQFINAQSFPKRSLLRPQLAGMLPAPLESFLISRLSPLLFAIHINEIATRIMAIMQHP